VFAPRPEIDWTELFGAARPVEIEIGCGKGAFLVAYAADHPDRSVLGIENQPRWTRWIATRLEKAPRANARIVCADAALVVGRFVPNDSVRAFHLYFPDPWWKRRHDKRRLVRADLAGHLYRALEPAGILHLATDVADRFEAMVAELSTVPFAVSIESAPTPSGRPLTNFERKYRAEGRAIHYATFTKPPAIGGKTLTS
jgi:tRNA (guanine-N7-)-methyltransferase